MSKKGISLSGALSGAAGKATAGAKSAPAPVVEEAPAPVFASYQPGYERPSRRGKVKVTISLDEPLHKKLRMYGIENDTSLEGIVKAGLNLWLESKGMPPVA